MKKVLFVTTIEATIRAFLLPYMKWFEEQGFEVHTASARGDGSVLPHSSKQFELSFSRSPLDPKNSKGYTQLKKIIDGEHYDLIHCHTPVASVYCRLAAKKARTRGTKVVYTAHGFHFYKGAPKKNWLIFYPVEKWLSKYTDCLITINDEDYHIATEKGFRAGQIEKVSGVGVDLEKFHPVKEEEKMRLRREKGVPKEGFILFYAAELSAGKNQLELLPIISKLKDEIPEIKVLLAGKGAMREDLERAIEWQGLSDYFQFLGFRKDVKELVQLSDMLISTSRREGLPVNIMEGMACGKPVVASIVRGNRDLVKDGSNGFTFELGDTQKAVSSIKALHDDNQKMREISQCTLEMVKSFSLEKTLKEYGNIYRGLLDEQ